MRLSPEEIRLELERKLQELRELVLALVIVYSGIIIFLLATGHH